MKKYLALLLALMLAVGLLAACGGDETTPPQNEGGQNGDSPDNQENNGGEDESSGAAKETLTIAATADIYSMDPQLKKDTPSGRIKTLVFETLVGTDAQGNTVPALAKSWEWIDDTTIRFTLNEGVTFHNGEPMTFDDIVYSFQRGADAPQTSISMEAIDMDGFTDLGNNQFEMKLKFPSGALMTNLADNCCSIVCKSYVEEVGEQEFAQKPIGTGPYTFSNWVAGDRVELTRYDGYWGDAPYFKNVVFRVITEAANRAIELETGGVDIALDVLPSDIGRIEDNPELELWRAPNYSVTYMAMNQSKKPFDDVRVRKAITLALDLPSIVDAVYGGTGSPGRGPMTPAVWGFNESIQTSEQNVEEAKKLLAEAGYPDGFETAILTSDHQQRCDFSEIAANQLGQIGITCEVKIMEWGAYLDAIFAGEHEMTVLGYSYGADPVTGLTSVFHSTMFGADGNISWYQNARVDELLDAAKVEIDDGKRREMVEELQQIIADDCVWVYIWQSENLYGTIKGLEGFEVRPDSCERYQDVSMK